ncbi:hypothetical protein AcW1_003118 [Taiwanofungus camphoratus]|nr:hypothetical protein AcV7_004768 [Antrodia cinnamomea]KAI0942505.1 hypothetical protein AcW1_003118 [Antrodia cinnamomea]
MAGVNRRAAYSRLIVSGDLHGNTHSDGHSYGAPHYVSLHHDRNDNPRKLSGGDWKQCLHLHFHHYEVGVRNYDCLHFYSDEYGHLHIHELVPIPAVAQRLPKLMGKPSILAEHLVVVMLVHEHVIDVG